MRSAYKTPLVIVQAPIEIDPAIPASRQLSPEQTAMARRANQKADEPGIPRLPVWVTWTDGVNVEVRGRCPHCRLVKAFHLSADPYRAPNCVTGAPWLPAGSNPPELVRLDFKIDEALPENLAYEAGLWRPDLLTYSIKAAGRGPWKRMHTEVAAKAILTSGVVDERIAIMQYDGGMHQLAAQRIAVARYIRRQPGRRMRDRIAHALWWSHFAAGQGQIDA